MRHLSTHKDAQIFSYDDLQFFSLFQDLWQEIIINFIINLLFNKRLNDVYDFVFVIINRYIKMTFYIFVTKKIIAIELTKIICHEMWLLIILKMRKSCINDKTIAKIMIIREEFYSKNVMWSILQYNTNLDYLHILIWRWIILIELI
jgi:hypothetical protein